jgi:CYTH domain
LPSAEVDSAGFPQLASGLCIGALNAMEENLELEIKVRPSTQVKLLLLEALAGRGSASPDERVRDLLDIADFAIKPRGLQVLRDEYFDNSSFTLLNSGISCRVRASGKSLQLTIKSLAGTKQIGLLPRQEHSADLTIQEYRNFIDSGDLPSQFQSVVPGIPIGLKSVLRVTNERTLYSMGKADQQFTLSVDHFTISDSGGTARTSDLMEIEIEAENDPARAGIGSIRESFSSPPEVSMSLVSINSI